MPWFGEVDREIYVDIESVKLIKLVKTEVVSDGNFTLVD